MRLTMASCRTCIFAGLEPATEAEAHRPGGRFIRVCALGRRCAANPQGCANWTRDPGEDFPAADFAHAVRQAREAQA